MQGKIITYGCKLNQAESALWRKNVEKEGVIVINACSVTSYATKEIRKKIRRIKKDSPDAIVYVTGCMEKSIIKTAIESGCYVVDRDVMDKLFRENTYFYPDNNRAFIIIQKGCFRFCRYCIVPYLRDKLISIPYERIRDDIYKMYDNGYREFVLTGTHIGLYNNNGLLLSDLLEKLYNDFRGKGIRIRLGSLEVFEIDDKLRELYKEPFLCRHIHLSVQSFNDKVLKIMGRTYKLKDVEKEIEYFSNIGVFIGVDIIVAHPFESRDDFNKSIDIIKSLPISFFHVFRYSRREGTVSALLENHHDDEIAYRLRVIRGIIDKKKKESFSMLPDYENIVIEKIEDGMFTGRLSNYMVAKGPFIDGIKERGMYKVRILKDETLEKGGDYVFVSVER